MHTYGVLRLIVRIVVLLTKRSYTFTPNTSHKVIVSDNVIIVHKLHRLTRKYDRYYCRLVRLSIMRIYIDTAMR